MNYMLYNLVFNVIINFMRYMIQNPYIQNHISPQLRGITRPFSPPRADPLH